MRIIVSYCVITKRYEGYAVDSALCRTDDVTVYGQSIESVVNKTKSEYNTDDIKVINGWNVSA